jgi:hypothetical protein
LWKRRGTVQINRLLESWIISNQKNFGNVKKSNDNRLFIVAFYSFPNGIRLKNEIKQLTKTKNIIIFDNATNTSRRGRRVTH